jgi:hypothetical protein
MGRRKREDVVLTARTVRPPKPSLCTPRPPKKAAVDILDAYVTTLQSPAHLIGSTIVKVSETTWAIREYKTHCGQFAGLDTHHFHHISKVQVQFKHCTSPETFLVCSCDAMELSRDLLIAGFNGTSHTRSDSKVLAVKCLHVRALEKLGFAEHAHATRKRYDESVAVLHDRDGSMQVSIRVDDASTANSRALIFTDANKHFRCNSCQYKTSRCLHVETLKDWIEERELWAQHPFVNYGTVPEGIRDVRPCFQPKQCREVRVAVTKQPIPLMRLGHHALQRLRGQGPWLTHSGACIPSHLGTCDACGAHWDDGDPVRHAWVAEKKATLYGPASSQEVVVYYRPCTGCQARKPYEGREEGVFAFSNQTLFLDEVMLNYVDSMVESRMTFYAYHSILRTAYERTGQRMCSETTLRLALLTFIETLDIDYAQGFECPVCATLPPSERVVIMDGKVMGFRKDLQKPEAVDPAEPRPDQIVNVAEMAYIRRSGKKDTFAQRLRAYAKGKRCLDLELLQDMERRTPELLWMVHNTAVGESCPLRYQWFLRDVATEQPLPTLIPRVLVVPLRRMIEATELMEGDKTLLRRHFPALFDLVQKNQWQCIVAEAKPLLRKLVSLADIPHRIDPVKEGQIESDRAFFPNNPLCRPALKPNDDQEDLRNICTKHTKRTQRYTPGIFALFCPHGVCLGFEAMEQFEGPMVPFNILYRRFEAAPKVAIYDNACNLSRTAYKYARSHFANTLWLVDRVHWHPHVNCHHGFCIDAYPRNRKLVGNTEDDAPQLDAEDPRVITFNQVNTQVCEQGNSKLEFMATQAKFMNQNSYMLYTKLFMYLCNMPVLKKLHNALQSRAG